MMPNSAAFRAVVIYAVINFYCNNSSASQLHQSSSIFSESHSSISSLKSDRVVTTSFIADRYKTSTEIRNKILSNNLLFKLRGGVVISKGKKV